MGLGEQNLYSFVKNNKYFIEIEELDLNKESGITFSSDLNDLMERKITNHPHEYLWQHRRFKSTLGKEKFYG